jgi:putative ABC transport system substrate-binding protein
VNRRKFITLLGGVAAGWPAIVRAQPAGKLPTIGFLGGGVPTGQRTWVEAFVRRLRELGWTEGRTIAIEYRWAEGRSDSLAEIAAEFVRLKVDLIYAVGTEAALAAKQATSLIPIVFPVTGDPIGTGLVAGLARPGGNVTGLSNFAVDLAARRLEILRDVFPSLDGLAVMANPAYSGGALELGKIQAAARTLSIEIIPSEFRRAEDIAPAFDALKGRAEAVYVVGDPLANSQRMRIYTFALAARLPTMYVPREYVETGGLMSYGPNYPDLHRRAADFVDKILRGAKPADLPVEQPTKYDFAINLITATALGLNVPPTLLARADEVIE